MNKPDIGQAEPEVSEVASKKPMTIRLPWNVAHWLEAYSKQSGMSQQSIILMGLDRVRSTSGKWENGDE